MINPARTPLVMPEVRLRITRQLHDSIDGIRLDRFVPGFVYEVGTELACYFLAERAAEPVNDDVPAVVLPPQQQLFGPLPPLPPEIEDKKPIFSLAEAADRPERRRRRRSQKRR